MLSHSLPRKVALANRHRLTGDRAILTVVVKLVCWVAEATLVHLNHRWMGPAACWALKDDHEILRDVADPDERHSRIANPYPEYPSRKDNPKASATVRCKQKLGQRGP